MAKSLAQVKYHVAEVKEIQVPYGDNPPTGVWHGKLEDVAIDYVPRGATWWLSTSSTHASDPSGDGRDEKALPNNPKLITNSNFEDIGNVELAPIDHRIILGTKSKKGIVDNEEARIATAQFVQKIRRAEGDFWVMDTDKDGNAAIYAISPALNPRESLRRPNISNASENFPVVDWPEQWHLTAPDVELNPSYEDKGPPAVKAPWRRLIVFQGVSRLARTHNFAVPCGPVYRNSGSDISGNHRARVPLFFNTDVDWLLEEHLAGTSGVANSTYQNGCHFQVSWFEVDVISDTKKVPNQDKNKNRSSVPAINEGPTKQNLRLGRLYGGQPNQTLRQGAFTIYAVAEDNRSTISRKDYPSREEIRKTQDYWTILILASLPGSETHFDEQQSYHDTIGKMQLTMARLAIIGLLRVWHGTLSVKSHIDFLLETFSDVFNPEKTDELLIGESLYANARTVTWIINTIYEVERLLERNINGWNQYHKQFIQPLIDCEVNDPKLWSEKERLQFVDEYLPRCSEMVGKVKDIRDEFKEREKRATSLREGLLSLASIAEAREATKLGQNVELLTYVSIFFLPLGFIATLWSVGDLFTDRAFVPTIILVSIFTYLLVFNIRGMIYRAGKVYGSWKLRTLEHMKRDESSKWGRRADEFRKPPPKATKKGSNWVLFGYWVLELFKRGPEAPSGSDRNV